VLESVIAVIASSSTFQKPVTRAETRLRVTITPTSAPVRRSSSAYSAGLRVTDADADRARSMAHEPRRSAANDDDAVADVMTQTHAD
jgi:hypothetical protein